MLVFGGDGGGGMSFDAGGRFSDSIMVRYLSYLPVALARLTWTGTSVPTGVSWLWNQHCSMWSLTKCSCRWFWSCVVVQLGLVSSGCLMSGGVDLARLGCGGCL